MNKHTPDIEGIVEEFIKKLPPSYSISTLGEDSYESIYIDIEDVKLCAKRFFQSQADQYERDLELLNRIHNESKGEMIKEMLEHQQSITNSDPVEPVVLYTVIVTDRIITIAQKYGVDLSE